MGIIMCKRQCSLYSVIPKDFMIYGNGSNEYLFPMDSLK